MLNFWLHLCAKLLCDNKTIILEQIKGAIDRAEALQVGDFNTAGAPGLVTSRPATGKEKFDYVRTQAGVWLAGKKGWIIDTVVQILVAWVKRKAGVA